MLASSLIDESPLKVHTSVKLDCVPILSYRLLSAFSQYIVQQYLNAVTEFQLLFHLLFQAIVTVHYCCLVFIIQALHKTGNVNGL